MSDYLTTPNLGLFKPNYNADVGQWGSHLNFNADVLDSAFPHGTTGTFLPLAGTTTNDNAAAGNVGEFISSVQTTAQALTTATAINVTSLSLTAGDWQLSGEAWFAIGTGGATAAFAAISTTSATLPTTPAVGTARAGGAVAFPASQTQVLVLAPTRLSLAATTTVYLVAQLAFPSGTCTATGKIHARRMR